MADLKKYPDIYHYTDFRRYLADYQEARSRIEPSFTKADLCRRLGLPNSRSFFSQVVQGKPISQTFVERFISALELSADDSRYFRALVGYNQALTEGERETFFRQVIMLNKAPAAIVDKSAYAYYSEWHHSAVRTMLDVHDYDGDARELASRFRPRLSVRQVRESIRLLERLGFIAHDKNGFLRPSGGAIATNPYCKDEIVRRYQARCFDLGREAILDTKGSLPRNFTATVMSMSAEALGEVLKEIGHFKRSIRSILQKDSRAANRIYQMNLQFFPLQKDEEDPVAP